MYLRIDENGTAIYYNGIEICKEYIDGTLEYYLNTVLHRENGPAVINNDTKKWYRNGKLHREDGPAVVNRDGTVEWYIDGRTFCKFF